MSISPALLTLFSVIIASATAFSVAYMHRKQMRQNELFKVNQAVGLAPSASPPTAFVRRHGFILVGTILPVLNLALEVIANRQPTTRSVVLIGINLMLLLGTVLLWLIRRLIDGINGQFQMIVGITNILNELLNALRTPSPRSTGDSHPGLLGPTAT